jgi:hypothetical protein
MARPFARLIVFIAACIAAPAAAQSAVHCDGVLVTGDGPLVSALERRLASIGCPRASGTTTHVEITTAGPALRLVIGDADGANEVREPADIASAALLVEAWREAAGVDLLEPTMPSVVVPDAPATSTGPPPESVDALGTSAPQPRPALATIQAHGIAAFGNEGSTWFGADAAACVHAGPFCIGGVARFLMDANLDGGAAPERDRRTLLGGGVGLQLPLAVANWLTLTPSIGLGIAWFDSVAFDGARLVRTDGVRVIVDGALSAAVALADWLSLELSLAVLWSPMARQRDYTTDGAVMDADPVAFGTTSLGLRAVIR